MSTPTKLYRYDSSMINDHAYCIQCEIIGETTKGYWIHKYGSSSGYPSERIWVSKTGKKRYAYPTKEEALIGFIKRKERYVHILMNRLKKANSQLYSGSSQLQRIYEDKVRQGVNQNTK